MLDHSPSPTRLVAFTLKEYSYPATKSDTVAVTPVPKYTVSSSLFSRTFTNVYETIAEPSLLVGAVHCSPIEFPVLVLGISMIEPGAVGKPAALTVITGLIGPSSGLRAVSQN